MRHHAPPPTFSPAAQDHRVCLAAVLGTTGSERAATWLAAALAGCGEPVGLLTESCLDDGEHCLPRTSHHDHDTPLWLERCGQSNLRMAVAQATPSTPVRRPSVVCVTSLRADGLNASAGRCWASLANQRADLRRCADLKHFDGVLVVNADDPDATRLGADHRGLLLTYGRSDAADLRVETLETNPSEQALLATHGTDSVVLTLRVSGSAARRDAAAALATCLALTGDLGSAARALEFAGPAAGRLEPISVGQDFGLWLDAAVRPLELAEAIEGITFDTGRLLAIVRLADDPAAAQQQLELLSRATDRAFAYGNADGLIAPRNVSLVEDELAALAVGIGLADPGDRVLAAGLRGQDGRDLVEALIGQRLACETSQRAA